MVTVDGREIAWYNRGRSILSNEVTVMAKAAFIGAGNMGSALAKAACKSLGGDQVAVANRSYHKAEALAKELGCQAYPSNLEAARAAEIGRAHV